MSPEILVKDGPKFNQASLHDLMVSDIWSLGMTFFTMINPNLKRPYLLEIRSSEKNIQTQEDVQNFVGNRLRQKERPVSDIKYNLSRATVWSCLGEVYIRCTSFDFNMRFSLREVEEVLNDKYDVDNTYDVVKMKFTQATAIEQMDHQVAIKLSVENDTGDRAEKYEAILEQCIDPIHKWRLFYFCCVIVQISLPSLTLEQEFFLI